MRFVWLWLGIAALGIVVGLVKALM